MDGCARLRSEEPEEPRRPRHADDALGAGRRRRCGRDSRVLGTAPPRGEAQIAGLAAAPAARAPGGVRPTGGALLAGRRAMGCGFTANDSWKVKPSQAAAG